MKQSRCSKQQITIILQQTEKGVAVEEVCRKIATDYGRPKRIRMDNGPEFISKELDLWAGCMASSSASCGRTGRPTDNAFAESYNGKFRSECLNAYWFHSLDDAQLRREAWRSDYNEVRPHGAIGNQTPFARAFASGQAYLTRCKTSRGILVQSGPKTEPGST